MIPHQGFLSLGPKDREKNEVLNCEKFLSTVLSCLCISKPENWERRVEGRLGVETGKWKTLMAGQGF